MCGCPSGVITLGAQPNHEEGDAIRHRLGLCWIASTRTFTVSSVTPDSAALEHTAQKPTAQPSHGGLGGGSLALASGEDGGRVGVYMEPPSLWNKDSLSQNR